MSFSAYIAFIMLAMPNFVVAFLLNRQGPTDHTLNVCSPKEGVVVDDDIIESLGEFAIETLESEGFVALGG